jgi:DNA-binding transcriptional ArsR family regulator
MSVGELVKITSLSQPLVSFHLRVLKENGLMKTNRKGPFVYYSIKDDRILNAIDTFIEIFNEEHHDTDRIHGFSARCRNKKIKNRK